MAGGEEDVLSEVSPRHAGRRHPGLPQGGGRHRHRPVGGDRDEVGEPPEGDGRQGDPVGGGAVTQVEQDPCPDEEVGPDDERAPQPRRDARAGRGGAEGDLDPDGERHDPEVAEPHPGEVGEPTAGEPPDGCPEEEREGEKCHGGRTPQGGVRPAG